MKLHPGTFTGQALQHAVDASLLVANGNRPGVKDIVFVITDGKAADDVKTPADELRKMGATVSTVISFKQRGIRANSAMAGQTMHTTKLI